MNRIPVLNDEQRAGYGAPTTDVGAGLAPDCGACPGDGSVCVTECRLAAESPPVPKVGDVIDFAGVEATVVSVTERKKPVPKKPAAKAKAKK